MKLYVRVYAAVNSKRFAVSLYTEYDLRIEIARRERLHQFYEDLENFIHLETVGARSYGKDEWALVNTHYNGDKYLYYNNQPESTWIELYPELEKVLNE